MRLIKSITDILHNTATFSSFAKRMNDRIKQIYNKFGANSMAYQNISSRIASMGSDLTHFNKKGFIQMTTGKKGYEYFKENQAFLGSLERAGTMGEILAREKERVKQERGITDQENLSIKEQKKLDKYLEKLAIERNQQKDFIKQNVNDLLTFYYNYESQLENYVDMDLMRQSPQDTTLNDITKVLNQIKLRENKVDLSNIENQFEKANKEYDIQLTKNYKG